MSFRPNHAYGLSVGYQAVAMGPDVKDFSIIFSTLEGARDCIRERGPYFDAMWVIIGPNAFYMWDGAPVTHSLHRTIRETLLETYSSNTTSLTIGFPLNYIIDRNPLPKDQQGGYDAVIVQYPHYGPGATLFKTVWCLGKAEAIKALQAVNMDADVPGPMFKAIVAGQDEIYDKNGEPACRELYDSVKGITCYHSIADGNESSGKCQERLEKAMPEDFPCLLPLLEDILHDDRTYGLGSGPSIDCGIGGCSERKVIPIPDDIPWTLRPFGKIVYFPNTSRSLNHLQKLIAEHEENRTADKLDDLFRRNGYDTPSSRNCLSQKTKGFATKAEALSYIESSTLSAETLKRYGCYQDGVVREGPWPLPLILAVFDFSKYEATKPTYTLISQHNYEDGPTTGELIGISVVDAAILNSTYLSDTLQQTKFEVKGFKKCEDPLKHFKEIWPIAINVLLILIAVMVFPWYALDIAKQITAEKQGVIRNYLAALGVRGFVISCSWAVFFISFAVFFSGIATIGLKALFSELRGGVVFFSFLLYNVAQVAFILLMVALFGRKTSKLTSVYLMVVIMGGILASAFVMNPHTFQGIRLATVYGIFLFFPAPYLMMASYLGGWMKLGVSTYSLDQSPFEYDKLGGPGICLLFMAVDVVLYVALTAIIEALQDWTSLTDMCKRSTNNAESVAENKEDISGDTGLITLSAVCKTFGQVTVLKDVSIRFPGKKVTAFLGENGAGKSTTTNIMTGFLSPSAGAVHYDGTKLTSNYDNIMSELSYLPQENILYDHMSLMEHVKFYGWLKGLSSPQLLDACQEFGAYDLRGAEDVPGTQLSGGQKRKLGIFIAYLGDPKYIILDEPTSGVDVFSARTIWDVILRQKGTATTVISTHRIEDAEVLADDVVIIDKGMIHAHGTPLELKERLEIGFSLILDSSGMTDRDAQMSRDLVARNLNLDVNEITTDKTTTTFRIKQNIGGTEDFLQCIKSLEKKLEDAGNCSYGVSDATLGDVYYETVLRAHGAHRVDADLQVCTEVYQQNWRKNWLRQLCILLWRRVLFAVHTKFALLFFFAAPFILAAFTGFVGLQGGIKVILGEMKESNPFVEMNWLISFSDNTVGLYSDAFLNATVDIGAREHFSRGASKHGTADCGCLIPFGHGPSSGPMLCKASCCKQVRNRLPRTRNSIGFLYADVIENRKSGENPEEDIVMALNRPQLKPLVATYQNLPNEASRTLNSERNYVTYTVASYIDAAATSLGAKKLQIDRYVEYGSIQLAEHEDGENFMTHLMEILKPIFLLFAFPIIVASIRHFVVMDFSSGTRHLLDLAGVSHIAYWLSNFIVDIIQLLPVIAVLVATTEWWLRTDHPKHFPLYPLGLLTSIPYTYLLTRVYSGSGFLIGTAFDHVMVIVGLVVGAMGHLHPVMPSVSFWYTKLAYYLVFPCRIHPLFYVGDTMAMLMWEEGMRFRKCPQSGPGSDPDVDCKVFDTQHNIALMMIAVIFAVYTVLLFVIELTGCKMSCKRRRCVGGGRTVFLDPDVEAEASSAQNMLARAFAATQTEAANAENLSNEMQEKNAEATDVEVAQPKRPAEIKVDGELAPPNDANVASVLPKLAPLISLGLTKSYDSRKPPAVDNVTFSVRHEECFGLLGVNGAGKTTTFRMLTGLLAPDAGECYLEGMPLSRRPRLTYGKTMYCPQENTLCEYLTTSQHIQFFAKVAGYPEALTQKLLDTYSEAMDVAKYRNRKVAKLSGGNKRKVQLISSVIGCPKLAFLDEPTTGLDPTARQQAWNVIGSIKQNASVVLTSHSLDDCEALCDRLVIMVAGQFRCIGTIQYLKHKLGNKFTFRLKAAAEIHADVDGFIQEKLEGKARQTDKMPNWLIYEIHADDLGKLSRLYEIFAEARSKFGVETATVSQMTLQDVFFRMSKDSEIEMQLREIMAARMQTQAPMEMPVMPVQEQQVQDSPA